MKGRVNIENTELSFAPRNLMAGMDSTTVRDSEEWTVRLSIYLFVTSVIRVVDRDALGRDVGGQGIVQFLAVMFAVSLAASVFLKRRVLPKLDGYEGAMLGFTCLTLVSASRSFWPILSAAKTATFSATVLTAMLVCRQAGFRKVFRFLHKGLITLLGVGIVLGIAGVFPLFISDDFSGRTRLTVFVFHPGVTGDLTALAILIAPFLPKKPHWLLTALLFVANILTSAKTASIALVVSLCVVFVLKKVATIRSLLFGAAAGCVLVACSWYLLDNAKMAGLAQGPLDTLYGNNLGEEVTTVNGRVGVWKAAEPLMAESLFLGHGFDGVREALLGKFEWSGNSHNALLELLLAAGAPGALLFVLAWILAIRGALKSPEPWRTSLLGVHSYFVLTSFSAPIWTTSQFIAVFFLTVLNCAARESSSEVRVSPRTAQSGISHMGALASTYYL